MRYLSAEEIFAIHDRILEADGGLVGVRDLGLLYSLAERPKTSFMGQEMYSGVFLKAAVYVESIATYHVFADGNKRSALAVGAIFLEANGHRVTISILVGFRFMLAVAQKKKTIEQIAEWLKKNSRKSSPSPD